jgi:hypothetical protein
MSVQGDDKRTLDKRFETIGWGLFLLMVGGLALVPKSIAPEGTWAIGVGLIMLGLNLARHLNGIPVSGFTVVVGFIALASGLGDVFGADLPIFPIVLILIGASIILRPMIERRH